MTTLPAPWSGPATGAVAARERGLIHTQVGPRNAWTSEQGLRYYNWRGQSLISVTTLRRLAGMTFGLHQWALTQVVTRAVDGYADLGKIIDVGTPESVKAAGTWLRKAATDKRDEAAQLGIRVHDAAAHRRPLTEVGADVAPYLRQYYHWLDVSRAYIIDTERQVFNLRIGYAGTFDLMAQLPNGSIWLIDIKTGKGTYADHALQGIAYAMAQFVGEDDVVDRRMTRILRKINGVAILHLGPEHWTWSEVKLTPELWTDFLALHRFAVFCDQNPTIKTLIDREVKGAA